MCSRAYCFEVTVEQSYVPLKISLNFLYQANSFYGLQPIKLKLDLS